MKKVENIRKHPLFLEQMAAIAEDEENRIFCRHNMEHLLSVARITTILCEEKNIPVDRELIYAVALLHDIGRHQQYAKGIPHEEAGAGIASRIMKECGFDAGEIQFACSAIAGHRVKENGETIDFATLFAMADKKSRPCFCCDARAECNWPEDKKNLEIEY